MDNMLDSIIIFYETQIKSNTTPHPRKYHHIVNQIFLVENIHNDVSPIILLMNKEV